MYTDLSPYIIDKYADKLDWTKVCKYHQKLTEETLRKHIDRLDWHLISSFQNLSVAFMEEYSDKLNWKELSYTQTLTEDLIRRQANKIDWLGIPFAQKLSEGFLEEFEERWGSSWGSVVCHQDLSENFITKHRDKLDMILISGNQQLSYEYILKNLDNLHLDQLLLNRRLKLTKKERDNLVQIQGIKSHFNQVEVG